MMTAARSGEGAPASHLATMLEPRSVALVGASEKSIWTHLIVKNFRELAYTGTLHAVNRSGAEALGISGYRSCAAIGQPVDLAFIFVPQDAVLEALEDAAAAGIRNAVVLTSGYGEAGEEGATAQRMLLDRATALGILIWGPNSLGFNNIAARTPISAIPVVLPVLQPRIAIVSQSGATASELNEFAHSQNIGTSFVGATGNEAQISLAEVIDYLVHHGPTKAIAVFAETIRDPAAFARASERARTLSKPIVVLKVGRSKLANAVAQAHTGSLVGDDTVFEAVCDRLGVIRVSSVEDLINTAGLIAATGPIGVQGLGFMSISGGACTLVADAAEAAGVALPANDDATVAALQSVLPPFASTLNPLDVTGAVMRDPDLFARVIPVVAASPEIGLLAVSMTVPNMAGQGLPDALAAIGRATAGIGKPAIMITTCDKALNDISRDAIDQHGLPHVITGIDAALRAIDKAFRWSAQLTRVRPPLTFGRSDASVDDRPTTERAVLDYLATAGVPVIPGPVVRSPDEALAVAARFGGELVLKISSPDIAHKTEVGGVRLNVRPADAGNAFDQLLAAVAAARPDATVDGVIVSPMRNGGIELLVGITRDPTWGPTIAVGFGGVLVELLADVIVAPLPVGHDEVIEMLARLRGARLFEGYRGAPGVDMRALADAIVRIGNAALALGPGLASLEVNPLICSGSSVEAIDALALWDKGAVA